MEACRMVVRGIVQGVGFRYFTRREAHYLGLTGWVKNNFDGSVEIWAEGDPAGLDKLEQAVNRGPSGAHVSGVLREEGKGTGQYDQFEISY
ncbi:MAG: acylphosphatase [Spirochaetales bacterium]|nr:acylphosphatase [Spirochaetales bacterium]